MAVLLSAQELENGMNVRRYNPAFDGYRWHKISDLQIRGDEVAYTAEYEDGTSRFEAFWVEHLWESKNESDADEAMRVRCQNAYTVILKLLQKQAVAISRPDVKFDRLSEAEKAMLEIAQIFTK